jgi:hypothetical protein
MCYQYHKVYTQNITHSTIGLHILFNYNQSNHMYSQGRQEGGGGGGGGGGGDCTGPPP